MHIYFLQDKDGYKEGWSGIVERSLARRFCENGIAMPYQDHLDQIAEAKAVQSEKERVKESEAAERAAEAEKRKADAAAKKKDAASKKAGGRSKATP